MRIFFIILLILLALAGGWFLGAQFGIPGTSVTRPNAQADVSAIETVLPSTIHGQGKLLPASGLINIVAAPGERITRLTDKQIGDRVSVKEILATLYSRVLREKDLALAQSRLTDVLKNVEYEKQQAGYKLKSAQLALAEAAASDQQIAKQSQAIGLLESQLQVAQKLLDRLKKLQANSATKTLVNQSDIDKQTLVIEQLRLQIDQAQVDVELATESAGRARQVAQNNLAAIEFSIANGDEATPLQSLKAGVDLAQQALDLTQIRAPIDQATILDIIVREGDSVTNQPIMVLGDLSNMNCEVEIVDSFLGLVDLEKHDNLRAKITGSALKQPLFGTVIAKGLLIGSVSLKVPNPFAKVDQRTGVVTIRLDDSATAAQFVNLQVDVEIEVEPGALKIRE